MVSEFDLPCTECDRELVAREVSPGSWPSSADRPAGATPPGATAVGDKAVGTETPGETTGAETASEALTVAECPGCGSRYYPEEALARLSVH